MTNKLATKSVPVVFSFYRRSLAFIIAQYINPPITPPTVLYKMSAIWNVPKRSNNCSISMLTEKINAIFPLYLRIFFQLFPIFFPNVHSTAAENGTIIITFSMHSVVSLCSPFTVSQMPHPPMTSDNGFNHRFRFNSVLNRISDVTKANRNSFRKNTLSLNF